MEDVENKPKVDCLTKGIYKRNVYKFVTIIS